MLYNIEINNNVVKIKKGLSIALIGASGSGKSFYLQQMEKFFNIHLVDAIFDVTKKLEYDEDSYNLLKYIHKTDILKKEILSLEEKAILAIVNNYNREIVLLDDIFSYINSKNKTAIFKYFKKSKKTLIFSTSSCEELLFAEEVIYLENGNIFAKKTLGSILLEEKKLKSCGIWVPFIVDLSIQLKIYQLISKVYYNEKDLVKKLWMK